MEPPAVTAQLVLTLPQPPLVGLSSISLVSCTWGAASPSARPQVQSLQALRPAAPTSQSSRAAAAGREGTRQGRGHGASAARQRSDKHMPAVRGTWPVKCLICTWLQSQ